MNPRVNPFQLIQIIIWLSIMSSPLFAQPGNRGANFSAWFQFNNQYSNFNKYDSLDFQQAASLGFDWIRIPVDVKSLLGPAPDYSIDKRFLFLFDQVIRWADAANISIILDNHTFDPIVGIDTSVESWLTPAWKQLALYYQNKNPHLLFEILNEPHGISDVDWNAIQQRVVAEIRKIDANRWLIIGGSGYNGISNLAQMPVYPYDNLIYTFHFYEPFLFTHQGANWTSHSLVDLKNLPFPYRVEAMPSFPTSLVGTWIESAFNDWKNAGKIEKLTDALQPVIDFKINRHVPVFCGEFGVYRPNAPLNDRIFWYKKVNELLETNDIGWTMWDYRGGFGLFKENSSERFYHDLNTDLCDSLGLNTPIQTTYIPQPYTSSFTIYDQFLRKGFSAVIQEAGGNIDFMTSTSESELSFAISMSNTGQYARVGFNFKDTQDLSNLFDEKAKLTFEIKVSSGVQKLDLQFVNPESYPEKIPWRLSYYLNKNDHFKSSDWNSIAIPFSDFFETGAWVNQTQQWFNPKGEFNYSDIKQLTWVAESQHLLNETVLIRSIRVVIPTETSLNETTPNDSKTHSLHMTVFPNPFNPNATIEFELKHASKVKLTLFDLLGRILWTHSDAMTYGISKHTLNLETNGVPSGIYFLQIRTETNQLTQKISILK